jgi:hypothetical protein
MRARLILVYDSKRISLPPLFTGVQRAATATTTLAFELMIQSVASLAVWVMDTNGVSLSYHLRSQIMRHRVAINFNTTHATLSHMTPRCQRAACEILIYLRLQRAFCV